MIGLLRRKVVRQPPLGPALASLSAVIAVLERVGATSGARYYRLLHGTVEVVLGDLPSARESLAIGRQCDATELPDSVALTAFLEALIAVESRDEQAPELVAGALQLCNENEEVRFVFDVLPLAQRIEHGQAPSEELRVARARERRVAGRLDGYGGRALVSLRSA